MVSRAPNARGRGPTPSAPQFWSSVSIRVYPHFYSYIHTLCRRTAKLDVVKHIGKKQVFKVSHAPTSRWRYPSAPQFSRFPSIYVFNLCRKTIKSDVVTHVAEGIVSCSQLRLPSQDSGVPGLPNFGCFPVFMPTSFNAERPNSAW